MNGWPHHTGRKSGWQPSRAESKAAVPIVLEPGQHWIEVKQDDHHLTPLRDDGVQLRNDCHGRASVSTR
jgi:hypothetical protein